MLDVKHIISVCLASLSIGSIGFCFGASGQTVSCDAVLRYGLFDRQSTTNIQNRFSQYQDFICESNAGSSSDWSSEAGKIGIDIADLLKIDFGGNKSNKHFSEWKSAFCASQFSLYTLSSNIREEISRASSAILSAWEHCIENPPNGFYIYAVPDENYSDITVHVVNRTGGVPRKLSQLYTTLSEGVTCDYKMYNATELQTFSFGCRKPAEKSASITLTADPLGDSNTVKIPGKVGDAILDLQARIATLEEESHMLEQGLRHALRSSPSGLAVETGRVDKTDQGKQRFDFDEPFSSPPYVYITVWWDGTSHWLPNQEAVSWVSNKQFELNGPLQLKTPEWQGASIEYLAIGTRAKPPTQ